MIGIFSTYRQNLGQSGNNEISDRLGFSQHMKTRLILQTGHIILNCNYCLLYINLNPNYLWTMDQEWKWWFKFHSRPALTNLSWHISNTTCYNSIKHLTAFKSRLAFTSVRSGHSATAFPVCPYSDLRFTCMYTIISYLVIRASEVNVGWEITWSVAIGHITKGHAQNRIRCFGYYKSFNVLSQVPSVFANLS